MKQTARTIIGTWIENGITLTGMERMMELPIGSLRELHENEGPAPHELETILNEIGYFPILLDVDVELGGVTESKLIGV